MTGFSPCQALVDTDGPATTQSESETKKVAVGVNQLGIMRLSLVAGVPRHAEEDQVSAP